MKISKNRYLQGFWWLWFCFWRWCESSFRGWLSQIGGILMRQILRQWIHCEEIRAAALMRLLLVSDASG